MLTDGGRVERDFPKRDKGKMDRAIDHVQGWLGDRVWFAFRHLPLTEIHPHALAAEAAALQDRFWEGSGEVRRTPTLFLDGVVRRGGCGAPILFDALAR